MPTKERRRYIRAFVYTPAMFTYSKLEKGRAGIIDISLAGLRMTTDQSLEIGQCLHFEFTLPNGIQIKVTGIVKHRHGIFYGIRFDPKDIQKIINRRDFEKYITKLRAEQDSWLRQKVVDTDK